MIPQEGRSKSRKPGSSPSPAKWEEKLPGSAGRRRQPAETLTLGPRRRLEVEVVDGALLEVQIPDQNDRRAELRQKALEHLEERFQRGISWLFAWLNKLRCKYKPRYGFCQVPKRRTIRQLAEGLE